MNSRYYMKDLDESRKKLSSRGSYWSELSNTSKGNKRKNTAGAPPWERLPIISSTKYYHLELHLFSTPSIFLNEQPVHSKIISYQGFDLWLDLQSFKLFYLPWINIFFQLPSAFLIRQWAPLYQVVSHLLQLRGGKRCTERSEKKSQTASDKSPQKVLPYVYQETL